MLKQIWGRQVGILSFDVLGFAGMGEITEWLLRAITLTLLDIRRTESDGPTISRLDSQLFGQILP